MLIGSLLLAVTGAGAFALAALGGGKRAGVDVLAANTHTARVSSVHYTFTVRMEKRHQPLVLHISGGSSRDATAVHLRLADVTLPDGTTMPGATGAIMLTRPFLYERAPGGVAVFGNVRWLRLHVLGRSPRSQVLSTVRSMTPSPLLRVIAQSRLHAVSTRAFAGAVDYANPVVRTALHSLAGGLEFRNLHLFVTVGRADGLIHRVQITGRTADGRTRLSLRARLYGFGTAVSVVPPKPGTFLDEQLSQLTA